MVVCHLGTPQVIAQESAPQDYRYHYGQGAAALEASMYPKALFHFRTADKLRPGHQIILFQLGKAYALNQHPDSATGCLGRALAIKADFDLSDSALINLPQLEELKAFQKAQLSAVHKSSEVFSLEERDLHLESLAHDPTQNRLYLGSVRKQKILWTSLEGGEISEFPSQKSDSLWSVFGMKVHSRHLWVCTVNTPYMINQDTTLLQQSAVLKYDLNTEKLIKRYSLANTSGPNWFGDLTVAEDGTVYISDSQANKVYRISPQKDELELFLEDSRFLSLQGLDLDPKGDVLFLSDYVNGPFQIDLASKKVEPLAQHNWQISLKAIDGLYFHKGSLIVTQNQVVPMRVSQLHLNVGHDTINGVTYLEKGNPWLNEPTLGVIIGDHFYYVANSQWAGYTKDNDPKPWEELQDIKIFKVKL